MESKTIETGTRIKYVASLKCKVENLFNFDEVKSLKQSNLIIIVKGMIKDFEKSTGLKPTAISLDSELFSLFRDAINKENPENYQYSDKCVWKGIKILGGCSLKDAEVVISSWNEDKIEEIIEA